MSLETLTYMGLPDCIKLSNGTVDVIATTAIGPRLLFYGPTGGRNVLAHFPEATKETALGTWKPYGGHRLWVWPEVFPATYAPDNDPIMKRFTHERAPSTLTTASIQRSIPKAASRNWSYSGHIALSQPAILCRLRRNGIYSPKSR